MVEEDQNINDTNFCIKIPIKKIQSFKNGEVGVSIFVNFEPLNFKQYELMIISDYNKLFKISEYYKTKNTTGNYNVLYQDKKWFDNQLTDEEINNYKMDNDNISTQLNNINFENLFNFIDSLKFCKITNKLYTNLLTKDYIDKYISPVEYCIKCNNPTIHFVKLQHPVCFDCIYTTMTKKK